MKLWNKNITTNEAVHQFTVGNDRELDMHLAPFDVLGNMAHARMLGSIGLLSADEVERLQKELKKLLTEVEEGRFSISADTEDIHSEVEFRLTKTLGDLGKKIHTGRSRNDQVLVDLKMYVRHEIAGICRLIEALVKDLVSQSNRHSDVLMPGYTHFQVAMPSSVGLWLGAYAESLTDDLELLLGAYRQANKNPLGSGAGYGSSFPLDRDLTTRLLGFESPNVNVVYAQMTRGKLERSTVYALSGVAQSLARLAYDNCLYMSQNYGFLSYPDELTTGSSIMPHKKNPDVWELIRAKCNEVSAMPTVIQQVTGNLPSGYHRDFQVLKEHLIPAIQKIKDCLAMTRLMVNQMKVKTDLVGKQEYDYLFTVEKVNQIVQAGIPFREAYREVAKEIAQGTYRPNRQLRHTHLGSIGNLGNDRILAMLEERLKEFGFEKVEEALKLLRNGGPESNPQDKIDS